eukprot:scaffold43428_cov22-Cyclotella_meneghiniana.AAC.2
MTNEGSEVIQASNRRVATAKKAAAGAVRNLRAAKIAFKAARNAVEVAKRECNEASEELKNVEQSQEAVLKKWEVVDLVEEGEDDDDDDETLKCSNKSKKRAAASSDLQIIQNKRVRSISDNPDEIILSGCGVSEANGTYERDGDHNGSPRYSKKGKWKGENEIFDIFRCSRMVSRSFPGHTDDESDILHYLVISKTWFIGIRGKCQVYFSGICSRCRSCRSSCRCISVPPSGGWEVLEDRVQPPPKITPVYNNFDQRSV